MIGVDAKLLLSRELRHSIHKMSSDVQAAQLPAPDGASYREVAVTRD